MSLIFALFFNRCRGRSSRYPDTKAGRIVSHSCRVSRRFLVTSQDRKNPEEVRETAELTGLGSSRGRRHRCCCRGVDIFEVSPRKLAYVRQLPYPSPRDHADDFLLHPEIVLFHPGVDHGESGLSSGEGRGIGLSQEKRARRRVHAGLRSGLRASARYLDEARRRCWEEGTRFPFPQILFRVHRSYKRLNPSQTTFSAWRTSSRAPPRRTPRATPLVVVFLGFSWISMDFMDFHGFR